MKFYIVHVLSTQTVPQVYPFPRSLQQECESGVECLGLDQRRLFWRLTGLSGLQVISRGRSTNAENGWSGEGAELGLRGLEERSTHLPPSRFGDGHGSNW